MTRMSSSPRWTRTRTSTTRVRGLRVLVPQDLRSRRRPHPRGRPAEWIDEARELTADPPQVEPATYSAQDRDESIRAYRDAVRETIGAEGQALVDVRSPQEFSGDLISRPATSKSARLAAQRRLQAGRCTPGRAELDSGGTVKAPPLP